MNCALGKITYVGLMYLGADRALVVQRREHLYDADLGYGLDRALRGKKGRKARRKAIVSSLIKILLEPTSPAESEDELEM